MIKNNNEFGDGEADTDDGVQLLKKMKTQKSGLTSTTAKPKEGNSSFNSKQQEQEQQRETFNNFSFSSSESAKPEGEGDQFAAVFVPKKEEKREKVESKIDEVSGKRRYLGMDAYTKPIEQPKMAGPSKGSNNLRVTCRFDYQPDICKDYKETGYCGYGDSCKFLHDRGDYKTGWQLELEHEEEQKKKRERALMQYAAEAESDDENEFLINEEDDLPFACFICKQAFVKPVVTRCNHYFCESCATSRYVNDPRCAVCKDNTNGIFNVASNIIKKGQRIAAKTAAKNYKKNKKNKKVEKEHNGKEKQEQPHPAGGGANILQSSDSEEDWKGMFLLFSFNIGEIILLN